MKYQLPPLDIVRLTEVATRAFACCRDHRESLDSERHINALVEAMRAICEAEIKRVTSPQYETRRARK